MILTRPALRKIVKEALDEMHDKASSEYDDAGDEIIVQAMGDDIMAFLEGLPDDQKAELLDTFMGILTQQDPDIKNY